MASFVSLHGSWCRFKVKARARKVPGRARGSDDDQQRAGTLVMRSLGPAKQPSTERRTKRLEATERSCAVIGSSPGRRMRQRSCRAYNGA